jgi:hypothetical protein
MIRSFSEWCGNSAHLEIEIDSPLNEQTLALVSGHKEDIISACSTSQKVMQQF